MARITLDNVSKRYPDGVLAVDSFTVDIADGEFVVLVGPSGCGKSSLLNMVAGLEDVTGGTIAIDGIVVNERAPKDRDIAMVFQSYALYPHMTVRQNMAFPLELAGMDRASIASKVEETAAMLELTPHLDRRPAHLSGGQRQRVAMGRAMVRRPKAFLMDEPLSNLDARLRVQMRRQVAAIQDALGTTTLYVTHDQTEAMTLGDRVVVMRGGVAQQVGPPQQLYDVPANVFVAGFIGTPSMNFLPAKIDGAVMRSPLGELPLRERLRGAGTRGAADPAADRSEAVILGIRPEHFTLAGPTDERPGGRVRVVVNAIEAMGSDMFAYFTLGGEPARSALLDELAADAGLTGAGAGAVSASGGIGCVARLDAASGVRQGETTELWYEASNVHVFDGASGVNIGAR